ncbi:glycosyltransferase family 4 protein [Cohnella suwonensis]|uniref:Glycosyltransferase family 4 protein n=1 Tax=Cohnella suwonensis TaxID=696072 RepID=A0ABW0LY70_9BACL
MLKTAFVTPGAYTVPSSMGGSVERVVEKVVPCLLPDIDARIYGRLGKRLPARDRLNGVRIERFPATDKKRYFRLVCGRLAKFRPDVIQVENRPLWVPYLKRDFPYSRIIVNLHSTTYIGTPYLNEAQMLECLRAADDIQVNSEFLKSYICGSVPQVTEKILVNHLGVDASRFPGKSTPKGMAARKQWRTKMGWGLRPIILYVGRLVPQKGVHHLLSAIPGIIAAEPDALFVIVGSAQYGFHRQTEYVRRLYKQAEHWKKHVHFQPYVPHDQITGWFAMADIAVVPSVGQEAFGLVNIEAMAAELPVVATRAGGMKEIVVDGSTGYLVTDDQPDIVPELASRIGYLLAHESIRNEMGKKGKERVLSEFQWKHTAERWLKFQSNRPSFGCPPEKNEKLVPPS